VLALWVGPLGEASYMGTYYYYHYYYYYYYDKEHKFKCVLHARLGAMDIVIDHDNQPHRHIIINNNNNNNNNTPLSRRIMNKMVSSLV
jgi:hypothetical protein